jgi:hypothetical protein
MTPADLRSVLDRAVDELQPDEYADAIGLSAAFQARLLARLTSPASKSPTTGPMLEWRNAKEIAAELNLKPSAIYLWARTGRIPVEVFGRFRRFNLEAVRRALAADSKLPPLGTTADANGHRAGNGATYRAPTKLPVKASGNAGGTECPQ